MVDHSIKPPRPTLGEIEGIARQAGNILVEGFTRKKLIDMKGEIDLVTEVDREAEKFIVGEIKTKFPGQQIIAEESGEHSLGGEASWYIDPIDGTTNFAHGLPIFAVSIGYAWEGEVQLGVVYNPAQDELFSAEKGKGAWLNGRPIKTAESKELSRSLLVTGFPYDRFTNPDNNLDYFNKFALSVRGIRRLGSAALDLCSVACGRVDGYWEIRLEPWDIAAGVLIAREAGARVSKLFGEEERLLSAPCSVAAANPALHTKMIEVIQVVRQEKQV